MSSLKSEPKLHIIWMIDITGSMTTALKACKLAFESVIKDIKRNVLPVKISILQYYECLDKGSLTIFDTFKDFDSAIEKVKALRIPDANNEWGQYGEENVKHAFATLSEHLDGVLPTVVFHAADYPYHPINDRYRSTKIEQEKLRSLGFPFDIVELWNTKINNKLLFYYPFTLLDDFYDTYCQFANETNGIYHKASSYNSENLSQVMSDLIKRYFSILMQDQPHKIREVDGIEVVGCNQIKEKLTKETDSLSVRPSIIPKSDQQEYYASMVQEMAEKSKKRWTITRPDCIRFSKQMIIFIESLDYLKTGDPKHLENIKRLKSQLSEMDGGKNIKSVKITIEQLIQLKKNLVEDEYFKGLNIPSLGFTDEDSKRLTLEEIQKEFVQKICPLIKGLKIRIDPEKKGSHYVKKSYWYRKIQDLPNGLTCKTLKETLGNLPKDRDRSSDGSEQEDCEDVFLPLSGKESSFEAAIYNLAKNSHIMDSAINIATRRDLTDTVSSTFRKAITTKLYQKINKDEKLIEEAEEEAKAVVVDTIEDTFMEVIEEPDKPEPKETEDKSSEPQKDEEDGETLIEDDIIEEQLREVDQEEGEENETEKEISEPDENDESVAKEKEQVNEPLNQHEAKNKEIEDPDLKKERMEKKIMFNRLKVFTKITKATRRGKNFEEMQNIAKTEFYSKTEADLKNITLADVESLIEFILGDKEPKNQENEPVEEQEDQDDSSSVGDPKKCFNEENDCDETQLEDFSRFLAQKLEIIRKLEHEGLKERLMNSRKVSQLSKSLNEVWRLFRPYLAKQAKNHSKSSKIAEESYQRLSNRQMDLKSFLPDIPELIFKTMLKSASKNVRDRAPSQNQPGLEGEAKNPPAPEGSDSARKEQSTPLENPNPEREDQQEASKRSSDDWRKAFIQKLKELADGPSTSSSLTESIKGLLEARYTTELKSTLQKLKKFGSAREEV